MSSSSSISVTVRVRPFSIREAAQLTRADDAPSFFGDGSLAGTPKPTLSGKGVRRVVKVVDEQMLIFDPAEENPMARYQKTILPQGKRVKDMRFGFDRVFDETCSQQDVYEATTRPLLDSVLEGYNATVFAYGATGCGKTHTISGNAQDPGIIFRTCAELFERINEIAEEKEINLTLSYLEIYNETIRDLLIPGGSKLGLQLREDTNQNIAVAGLSTYTPKTVEQVMDMVVMGNANRTMSPTEANATSSRSHAVLQINVAQKPRTAGLSENHCASTLSIIDLAGSERASVTKNRGERLLEGANINRSLLALGNCINALCDPTRRNHVPYRDSKLTRLLKFSLGGNCKTVMIVCVSPSSQHYDETHNTLKYANRAKNIKTKVSRNIINVNRHVSEYVKAIYGLRQEVESLKGRLVDSTKEAMSQIAKLDTAKDAAIKDGIRRLKVSYEHSKDVRRDMINGLQNLRIIERRMNLLNAWSSAFDSVFESRPNDEPPAVMFSMRAEAQKVLGELAYNQRMIQQRLSGLNWEKTIQAALESSLRNLQVIGGVKENDLALLNSEATILIQNGKAELLQAMTDTDVDFSSSMQALAKAHFGTYAIISKIMDSDISDPDALEDARRALFDVQQGAGDAVSQIVKPAGELLSNEVYQPSAFSPQKKRNHYTGSPVKAPYTASVVASPTRPSSRHIKAKSPRKPVKFVKKAEKKRVRFQDELEDTSFDDSKRSRVIVDEEYTVEPTEDDMDYPNIQSVLQDSNSEDLDAPAPQGLMAPPSRPKGNKFDSGFLSKQKENTPPPATNGSSTAETPLQSVDAVDQVVNRVSSSADTGVWKVARPISGASRNSVRKSMSGAGPSRPIRRRSPSNSASPEGSKWNLGHAKRMPKGEKENRGSLASVLSPRSTGIKAAARRMTVGGAGGSSRLSSLTLAGLGELSSRQSLVGVGKHSHWR